MFFFVECSQTTDGFVRGMLTFTVPKLSVEKTRSRVVYLQVSSPSMTVQDFHVVFTFFNRSSVVEGFYWPSEESMHGLKCFLCGRNGENHIFFVPVVSPFYFSLSNKYNFPSIVLSIKYQFNGG